MPGDDFVPFDPIRLRVLPSPELARTWSKVCRLVTPPQGAETDINGTAVTWGGPSVAFDAGHGQGEGAWIPHIDDMS